MELGAEAAFAAILEIVDRVRDTQSDKVRLAARLLSARLIAGGIVHVFGAGHSKSFAMEMCGRAGGLVPFKLVSLEDVAEREANGGITLVELERDPDTARRLLAIHDVQPEDAFLIVSNSGRNGAPVQLALECRSRGLPVIAVTSLQHSAEADSRHPSGKKLFEVADVALDNCCPYGDVLMDVPELQVRTGSASTIAGAFIAQALACEIIHIYREQQRIPPIYLSANVDGGDEHNQALIRRYAHRRITY